MPEICDPESPGPEPQDDPAPLTIPVVEEQAALSRVREETGAALRVRIVAHEEEARLPATDIVEEISVERVPVGRYVQERSGPREEEGVVIVPVFETVAVVETRLLLKEELRIVRRRRELTRLEPVVLIKETPVVERRRSEQDEWTRDESETRPSA